MHHEIIYLQLSCTFAGGSCEFFNYNHETGMCCTSGVSTSCCKRHEVPNPKDDGWTTYVLRGDRKYVDGAPENQYKGAGMTRL